MGTLENVIRVVLFLGLAAVGSPAFAASIFCIQVVGGFPSEGSPVTLKQKGVGVVASTTIDEEGEYRFDVAAGTYKIVIKNVSVDGPTTVEGSLQVPEGTFSAGNPVKLKNVDTKAVRRTTTSDGNYTFAGVESGTYKIVIKNVVVP